MLFNPQNIPEELKRLDQWVVANPRSGTTLRPEKWKAPLDPSTLRLAASNDEVTWMPFDYTAHVAERNDFYLGCVATENDEYTFIDFDPYKEHLTDEDRAWMGRIYGVFQSYTEVSASGKGFHIVVKGHIPGKGIKHRGIEMWSTGKYMIFTGNVPSDRYGWTIADYSEILTGIYEEMVANRGIMTDESEDVDDFNQDETLTDEEILARATNSANKEKFQHLWDGNLNLHRGDHSAADDSLLEMLCFHSANNEQVRRLFRQSKLYRPDMSNRGDAYMNRSIKKSRWRSYTTSQAGEALREKMFKANAEAPLPVVIKEEALEVKDKELVIPNSWFGEAYQHFLDSAVQPVPVFALATTMMFMGGVVGRAYNVSNTGLNQYMAILATTGRGKEDIRSGINHMFRQIKAPGAETYIGPAHLVSGAGLNKHLAKDPCCISVVGEFGDFLQRLSNPNANLADKTLRSSLLMLYGQSGMNQRMGASAYSAKENNYESVRAPCFSMIGEGIKESFCAAMDAEPPGTGFLARFSPKIYEGLKQKANPYAGQPAPDALVSMITSVVQNCMQIEREDRAVPVGWADQKAFQEMDAFEDYTIEMVNKDTNQTPIGELWNRAHLKALKNAATLAVWENPYFPVMTVANVRWAIDTVMEDTKAILSLYRSGSIGEEEQKQRTLIRKAMGAYLGTNVPKQYFREAMWKDRVMPSGYLSNATQRAPFQKSKLGHSAALRNMLKTMEGHGELVKLSSMVLQQKYNFVGEAWQIVLPLAYEDMV